MDPKFFFTILISYLLIISFAQSEEEGRIPGLGKSRFNCTFSEEEAQGNPWSAALIVDSGVGDPDYFPIVILDEFTLVSYGRPFNLKTEKIAFRPWANYTVGIVNDGGQRDKANTKFAQVAQVSFMQPHPKFTRNVNPDLWMLTENDYIIIRLETALNLNEKGSRPVCLPQIGENYEPSSSSQEQLDKLYADNTTAVLGGWKRYKDLERTSLTIRLWGKMECEEQWKIKTRSVPNLPYRNRVCASVISNPNSNNPNDECVKDNGALVNHGGQYTYMGYANTFFSHLGRCDQNAFLILYKMSAETVVWLNAVLMCESNEYTCHDGKCVPFHLVCNQKNDGCADGSDEDPTYCRSINPCRSNQFACGDYGKCIPGVIGGKEVRRCDGVSHCPLGEDETNCQDRLDEGSLIGVSVLILILTASAILIRRLIRRNMGWTLEEKDIEEFVSGTTEAHVLSTQEERIASKPYNLAKFEISKEQIVKYERIGYGNFADVYKGVLKDSGKTCAIKIPKKHATEEEVKCFLKELKLMDYIGHHENITEFIGAYTKGLRDGILFIITEFCELGSLKDFFLSQNETFQNQLKISQNLNESNSGDSNYVAFDEVAKTPVELVVITPSLTTADLTRWATEIASGMDYLASKQLVHGDLSARNVLLGKNRVAKICDFGLSHHLYSSIYKASAQSKLPWKWMAMEVLLERALSLKSDIYSYGTTLWEMFSLGLDPYEQVKWSPEFAYSLSVHGCKLPKPKFASDETFQIMQNCWAIDPNSRPDFKTIISKLNITE